MTSATLANERKENLYKRIRLVSVKISGGENLKFEINSYREGCLGFFK